MKKNKIFLCLSIYLLLIALSFFLSGRYGLVYSVPGDSLSLIGLIRDLRHGFLSNNLSSRLVLYPAGPEVLFGHNFQPIFLSFVFVFSLLPLNAVITYQLLLTTIFFLSLTSAFYFFYKILDRDRLSTLLSVTIFMSSLYYQWRLAVHLELGMLFWLPPILFYLLRFLVRPNLRDVSFLFFLTGLQLMTSIQTGYLVLLSVSFLILVRFLVLVLRRQNFWEYLRLLALGSVIFLVSISLILINLLRILFWGTSLQKDWLNLTLTRNHLLDLVALSARPWDYLLPSIYHPVWGSAVKTLYKSIQENLSYQFHGAYLPERVNYLTWTALVLSIFVLFSILFRGKLENRRQLIWLFILAVFSFWLSMPPQINFRGFTFFSPSYFLYQFFPFFRVYARAGVLVLLSVAVISGFAASLLPKSRRVLITFILVSLVIFENLNFPPFLVVSAARISGIYSWLKEKTGDVLIVEYPKDNSKNDLGGGCSRDLDPGVVRDFNASYEYFYYTYHQKRVLAYPSLSSEERASLAFIDGPEAHRILKKYGVDYLLVHTQDPMIGIHPWPYPQENPLDECWSRRIMKKPEKVYEGFQKVAEFDDGAVYKLD